MPAVKAAWAARENRAADSGVLKASVHRTFTASPIGINNWAVMRISWKALAFTRTRTIPEVGVNTSCGSSSSGSMS